MINPLKVATAGYLKRGTKAVLIIAVAGYLNFGGTPPVRGNDGYLPPQERAGGRFTGDEQRDAILQGDNEFLLIVEIFMKCQA